MSSFKRVVIRAGWAALASAFCGACQVTLVGPEEEVGSNRFLDEVREDFWPSLDYDDPLRRALLSGVFANFDDIVRELEADLLAARYTNQYDLRAIGRVFFYYGHSLHSNVLVTLEGRTRIEDLIREIQFSNSSTSAPDFQRVELTAQMARSVAILEQAAALRPDDRRPMVALLAARTTQSRVLTGQTSPESVKALIAYATDARVEAVDQRSTMRFPNFDIMVTMLTLRNVSDPGLQFYFPTDDGFSSNAHMLNLASFIQRRVAPDLGPGFVEPTEEEVRELHFVAITAPVLRSDYFTRFAYDLWKTGQFDEAQVQLFTAQSAHRLIREKLYPLLDVYPLGDILAEREEFASALQRGIEGRTSTLSRTEGGQLKNTQIEDVFLENRFIAPYLCTNCHAEH